MNTNRLHTAEPCYIAIGKWSMSEVRYSLFVHARRCWNKTVEEWREKSSTVFLLAQWNRECREASRCDEEYKKVSIPNEIAIFTARDQRKASGWFPISSAETYRAARQEQTTTEWLCPSSTYSSICSCTRISMCSNKYHSCSSVNTRRLTPDGFRRFLANLISRLVSEVVIDRERSWISTGKCCSSIRSHRVPFNRWCSVTVATPCRS